MVLRNYGWEQIAHPWQDSPFEALMHATLSVRDLSPHDPAIQRIRFKHYMVCSGNETVARLPHHARDVLGEMTPEAAAAINHRLIGIAAQVMDSR